LNTPDTVSPTIFVAVAAYRDTELRPTLADCIEQAHQPERLYFGICNQYDEDTFLDESAFPHMRIHSCSYTESKGLGWAREQARCFYNDQDFILQLDAHMRFKKGWDDYCVDLAHTATRDGIERPLITAACPVWHPGDSNYLTNKGTKIGFKRFFDRGTIEYQPQWLSDSEQNSAYVRGVFISAHFLFAPGDFYEEYRFDPEIYFGGEEACLTVRAFTMGYDVIHPANSYVYHDYDRTPRKLHWLDHTPQLSTATGRLSADDRDAISTMRIRQLLEIEDNRINLRPYGLGSRRTLDEWISRSGIDVRHSKVLDTSDQEPRNISNIDTPKP